jgi:tetratricopeptide (TPR) repeat protein
MAFKYKLKEAPSPNLAAQVGAKIGDVSYSKDGDTKFVVNSIDKETGQIGWKVIELPAFDKLNDDVDSLVSTAKGVYTKTKDDEKFREIYEEARLLRNKIRKHLRNEYPDEYKRMTMEGEIEEATGVDGDVIDLNPSNKTKLSNYVKLPHHLAAALLDVADEMMADEADTIKNQPQIKQALALLKKAAEKAMTGEKEVEEMSTSAGAGSYLTKYAFRKPKKQQKLSEGNEEAITYFQQAIKLSHTNKVRNLILKAAKELGLEIPKVWTETVNENNKNPGATLGPGPKASEEGVKDNAYVKQFKYKLVPKDKNGNYVQKGSGLEVKNF